MQQKMSRRKVLIGIGGAAALAATGGVVYLAALRQIVKPDPHHLLTYTGHPYGPTRAAWSPDGTRVASIGELDTTVQVWQVTTGKKLLTCTLEDAAANTYPRDVMWSADGKSVLAVVAETKDGTTPSYERCRSGTPPPGSACAAFPSRKKISPS